MAKLIYHFGGGRADGRDDQVAALGRKGARLHALAAAGLPVPPGFTLAAGACRRALDAGRVPPALLKQVRAALRRLELHSNKILGSTDRPLLLAVRCGAATDVRGLMPTLLNVGINDAIAEGLARHTGDAAFAQDVLRRLRRDYPERVGRPCPADPMEQLTGAIAAAAESWNSAVARADRRRSGAPDDPSLAITVQAMVFGNLATVSGAGRALTRCPQTGEDGLRGEFLQRAQGADLTAGGARPVPLDQLRDALPKVWRKLSQIKSRLERRFGDAQEFHFTVERGRAYVLHARPANRTATASARIAVELAGQRIIDRRTAVLRVDPGSLETLLYPTFDRSAPRVVLATGFGASPGAAVGKIAFAAAEAESRAADGERVILVRRETEPADIGGMHVAEGVLTSTGGMTSHAAVVARGMGTPCVAGAGAVEVDARNRRLRVDGSTFGPDDWLSIDGGNGEVMAGQVPTLAAELTGPFKQVLAWADEFRALGVRANADTPRDAGVARGLGAEGIGLCRTEHMFFDPQRIGAMRQMILAPDADARRAALAKLLPYQREDFVGIFRAMDGLPVTIRLLDPPLHEFLPRGERDLRALARELGVSLAQVRGRVQQLHETNPMLGHRGDRLAITYPEILEMQVRAVLEAAIAARKAGARVAPEIMVPLAGTRAELGFCKQVTDRTAAAVFKEAGTTIDYLFGTMIEVPRAAVTADEMAAVAQFFSFGTNDLTQLTFGFSRDDVNGFLPDYLRKQILPRDPFQSIDAGGVGKLIRMAVGLGRGERAGLKCGLCGEHGGDPASVAFCHDVGLDYVSCSPYRVPVARLAAAHAALTRRPASLQRPRSFRK